MAAAVALGPDWTNPCCVKLKTEYLMLEEKWKTEYSALDEKRKALRQAVKFLKHQLVERIAENTQLKKACDEKCVQAELEKEQKEKESSIRHELEKELHDLKSEISSYQKSAGSRSFSEDEVKLLEARIFEGEAEIKRLRELLEKEKMRCDSEKKKAKVEKAKAAEANKLLMIEKGKAEEVKLLEAHILEGEAEIKRLRELLEKEKRRCDSEKKKTKVEREKAAEANKLLMIEKGKAEEDQRLAETERKKDEECRLTLEKLNYEVREKLIVEKSKADDLSQQLEEEKQRSVELQKKIEEVVPAQTGRRKCSCSSVTQSEIANVKLLREHLKLEKKRVKYAKRMAQLEKREKSHIDQQVNLLKQEFIHISFAGSLSHGTEGKEGMAKIEESHELSCFNLLNKFFGTRRCNFNSQSDLGLIKSYYNDSSNYSDSTREFTGLHLSGGSCTKPISGISSELESPIRDSIRNKSHSSAVCSTTTFSDRTFMGSQERDDLFITRSAKLTGSSSKRRSAVRKQAGEFGKIRQNENNEVVTENTDRSYVQRNVGSVHLSSSVHDRTEIAERVSGRSTKKRKIEETLEPIAWLCSKDNQLHLKINEKLSQLKDLLSIKDGLPTAVSSHSSEISNCLDSWRDLLAEKNGDLCKRNYKHGWSAEEQGQQKLDSQHFSQNDNQQQTYISESEGTRKLCFQSETAAPNNQVQDVNIWREESVNVVSSDLAALICFENVVCGDYLKLLELDNDDDERRYWAAVDAPLSPTLPEINSPRVQLYGEDESHYLVEGLPRRSESGRNNSMPNHTFSVIDLEIKANTVKLKTSNNRESLSHNNRDFTHLSEEPKCSYLFTSHSDFNQNGIEHNSYLPNSTFVDVEQTCDARESNDLMNSADPVLSIMELKSHWQVKPHVECLFDPNMIPNSNICDDSISWKIDKYLPSGDASHGFSNSGVQSKPFHEDRCVQRCNLQIHNLERNPFPVVNGQEKTLGADQELSLGLIKSPRESEGKELDDIVVAECVNRGLHDSKTRKLIDGGDELSAAGQAAQTSIHLVSESSTMTEAAKQMPLSTIRKLEDPCRGNSALERTPKYCVVFSNTKDEDSISRIIHARNTVNQKNMDQTDSVITEVLHTLKLKPNLLPEEKVSVLFSLLLYSISCAMSANSKSITNGDILCCSESLAATINRVISDGKARWLFQDICQLDILLNLIEDFLIGRKILMYDDIWSERLYPNVSSCKFYHLERGDMLFSYRAATVDQLVAASIILACICAAANRIGFLLETSYKILQMCRSDTSWVLLALHVFASVTGKKFFSLNNYSFLIAAIRSVVSLLERGHESLSSASPCLHSTCDVGPSFPPYEQCPFYTNAISVDKFTSLLLDVLQGYASGVRHLSSAYTVPECAESHGESTDGKYEFDGLNIVCDSSCKLFKYINATDQSDCIPERSLCHYTDIVSLVELVGCYMSWEWTSNNVMPRLLKMLESCVSEEFSAALFVLIGQLARLGIDAGGYKQTGVIELRCRLSMFLDTFITVKGCFPTQFAAVGALLNLLPLSFGEILDGYVDHSVDASHSSNAKLIKKWFSQLSGELQSLSLSLFR